MPNSIVHRSQRRFVLFAEPVPLCLMLLCVYALEVHVMRPRRRQISPMGAIKSIHLSCAAKAWYNSIKGLIKWQTLLFNGCALPLEHCCSPDCGFKRKVWCSTSSVLLFTPSPQLPDICCHRCNYQPETTTPPHRHRRRRRHRKKLLISRCHNNDFSNFPFEKWPPRFASLLIKAPEPRRIRSPSACSCWISRPLPVRDGGICILLALERATAPHKQSACSS